MTLPSVQW